MDSTRVLVAMGSESLAGKVKAILVEAGCLVIDQAGDGPECLRKLRLLKPDVVILDQNLTLMSGYDVAKVALEDKICSVVLIASLEQESAIYPLKRESNFVCLVKPVNRSLLTHIIELMAKNNKVVQLLEGEITELKANLDTRREVEKAKGLLMKQLGLSENDAFKRIQKQSMDHGIPMKEIAKAIILAYDV